MKTVRVHSKEKRGKENGTASTEGLIVQHTLWVSYLCISNQGQAGVRNLGKQRGKGTQKDACINTYQGEFFAPNCLTIPWDLFKSGS